MANSQVTVRDTQLEKQRTGYINLNLTALDTTAVPDITAGSVVEVGGSLYSFTSDETPTGWAGIANDTQAYIKLTPGASDVTSSFATTAPTYSDAKGGWYLGDDRYVARVYKDASGNATEKSTYIQAAESEFVPNDLDVGNDVSIGGDVFVAGDIPMTRTHVITATGSGTWTVPSRVYRVKAIVTGPGGGGADDDTDGDYNATETTFGSLSGYFGYGGFRGTGQNSGGGGDASGGDINISGGSGGLGTAEGHDGGGVGGASYWGGGENPSDTDLQAATNSKAYGSGGPGHDPGNPAGGAGGTAIAILSVTPGDSISYTVAAGGAGGGDGGDGADGVIYLEY